MKKKWWRMKKVRKKMQRKKRKCGRRWKEGRKTIWLKKKRNERGKNRINWTNVKWKKKKLGIKFKTQLREKTMQDFCTKEILLKMTWEMLWVTETKNEKNMFIFKKVEEKNCKRNK